MSCKVIDDMILDVTTATNLRSVLTIMETMNLSAEEALAALQITDQRVIAVVEEKIGRRVTIGGAAL